MREQLKFLDRRHDRLDEGEIGFYGVAGNVRRASHPCKNVRRHDGLQRNVAIERVLILLEDEKRNPRYRCAHRRWITLIERRRSDEVVGIQLALPRERAA